MVIGLLAITAIPTVTGIALGCSEQRKQNNREDDERRMAKFYTDIECLEDVEEADEIDGMRMVLRDNKAYIDHPDPKKRKVPGHAGSAFYINYPEPDHMKDLKRGLGLVSTIQDDPPMLNWLYADTETHEVKYGNRTQSCEHAPAPWDWTEEERTIILEKNRGFYAVREKDGWWAIYLDRDGDELQRVLRKRKMRRAVTVYIRLKRKLVEEEVKEQIIAEILEKRRREAEEGATGGKGQGEGEKKEGGEERKEGEEEKKDGEETRNEEKKDQGENKDEGEFSNKSEEEGEGSGS